jgi:hypothetical protein
MAQVNQVALQNQLLQQITQTATSGLQLGGQQQQQPTSLMGAIQAFSDDMKGNSDQSDAAAGGFSDVLRG